MVDFTLTGDQQRMRAVGGHRRFRADGRPGARDERVVMVKLAVRAKHGRDAIVRTEPGGARQRANELKMRVRACGR